MLRNRRFPAQARCGLFGSRSIAVHLLRGAIAAGLLAWALVNWSSSPFMALGAGAAAVFAMRGCPMCWTVGLIETVAARFTGSRDLPYAEP